MGIINPEEPGEDNFQWLGKILSKVGDNQTNPIKNQEEKGLAKNRVKNEVTGKPSPLTKEKGAKEGRVKKKN